MPVKLARALAQPALQATVPDLEFAHTILVVGCEPLDDAPILDLRIRKGVRRRGVRLAVATARPSALDPNAGFVTRLGPGEEATFLAALDLALAGESTRAEADAPYARLANFLRASGQDIVIVWGERIGPEAAPHLLSIANRLEVWGRQGAGLLEIPSTANGRGLREAGVVPDAGPGYKPLDKPGRDAAGIARAAADGELTALYLFQTDPLRDQPDRATWERALDRASLVVAHASVLTDGLKRARRCRLPGRLLRGEGGHGRAPRRADPAHAHGDPPSGPGARRLVGDRGARQARGLRQPGAHRLDGLPAARRGGSLLPRADARGARRPRRALAARVPRPPSWPPRSCRASAPAFRPRRWPTRRRTGAPSSNGALRLGRYRPIWAAPEVEISPALKFTVAQQQVELSPEDAARLGIGNGEDVEVAQNGTKLHARAAVRSGIRTGIAFLADGIAEDSANELTEPFVEVRKR